MELCTGDECGETPQQTTTNNMKATRFNMQRRVQKDHDKSTHRAYMTRTSIVQDNQETNPNIVSSDLDTSNISPSSSEPKENFITYFDHMFQQDPKSTGSGGGGRKQPRPKQEYDNNPKKLSPSSPMIIL
jgi:hypothetical protein